jgi:hypothetical protein
MIHKNDPDWFRLFFAQGVADSQVPYGVVQVSII